MTPFIQKPEHRINLLKLARYLYMVHLMKPKSKKFDMGHWYEVNECGVTACALGYSSIVFRENPKYAHLFYNLKRMVNWDTVSEVLYGIPADSLISNYIFGRYWIIVDNSPRGAAIRIIEALYRKSGSFRRPADTKNNAFKAYKRRQYRYEDEYLKDGAINEWIAYEREQAKQQELPL